MTEIYNFDHLIPRKNTNCVKWDIADALFREKEILPMWVADMDLPIAKPITEALKQRADHEIYGYGISEPQSTVEAVISRLKRKYNWDVNPEWVLFTPGVVPSIFHIIRTLTIPGDAILLQDPVYYPFWSAIEDNGCQVANNPLLYQQQQYTVNFDHLEECFKPKNRMGSIPNRIKGMLLCNPHNPVGRVWSRDELVRMGEIVIKHNAVMIADEIHCELLLKGARHIPFASISKEFEQNSITCMAPSKTFNLAGLDTSIVIIPNPDLRNQFKLRTKGFLPSCNVFGLVALEAAYRHGDIWLNQFLAYLEGNLALLTSYFEQHIPEIKVIHPEGTYLVWLDCRSLGLSARDLESFMNQEAKVGLDHGVAFGPSGDGFERINIACPRPILQEALVRIEKAVRSLSTQNA